MQVCGVVQLLIFQHLALFLARAHPLNDVASKCNGSTTSFMSQIHSLVMDIHMKAKVRFNTYAHCQEFDSKAIVSLCHSGDSNFPTFNVISTSSEEDKLSELYKVFRYMNTAIGNITLEQMELNPKNKTLHKQLNESKIEIAAVLSNLSCALNKRYKVPNIDMYYKTSTSTWFKKTRGCKVLKSYKHFLAQASNITSDWDKKGDYTQDPSFDNPPDHR
ncbi:leukemia inhibitory factor isoform X2 [Eleutherodactylus coqui]|uniref:leukemia inhibitory factor isoform X2 n=1 Tax=Eleutherodactylus coqui TaxID=57060 RepID=UPI0034633911